MIKVYSRLSAEDAMSNILTQLSAFYGLYPSLRIMTSDDTKGKAIMIDPDVTIRMEKVHNSPTLWVATCTLP
jgi:hypothetical protein